MSVERKDPKHPLKLKLVERKRKEEMPGIKQLNVQKTEIRDMLSIGIRDAEGNQPLMQVRLVSVLTTPSEVTVYQNIIIDK